MIDFIAFMSQKYRINFQHCLVKTEHNDKWNCGIPRCCETTYLALLNTSAASQTAAEHKLSWVESDVQTCWTEYICYWSPAAGLITAVGGCSEVPGLRSMLIRPQSGCRFTYCSLNNEQRNQKGADVTRAPLMCCIVLAHGQLQTNDFIYFVCVFFNRRVLILWTILCCICSLRLTQAQGKAVWRQDGCLLAFLSY